MKKYFKSAVLLVFSSFVFVLAVTTGNGNLSALPRILAYGIGILIPFISAEVFAKLSSSSGHIAKEGSFFVLHWCSTLLLFCAFRFVQELAVVEDTFFEVLGVAWIAKAAFGLTLSVLASLTLVLFARLLKFDRQLSTQAISPIVVHGLAIPLLLY